MARNINHVVITGNLTRDPELRALPSGTSVCELGVAVNESVKNSATGEWDERVNFFDVTVWGKQADSCGRYLAKGRPVAVSGRLRWESWEKDGQKRSKVKIVADMVQFLGDGKQDGGGSREEGYRAPDADPAAAEGGYRMDTPSAPAAPDDDDIPF